MSTEPRPVHSPQPGWHWAEWSCEFFGTAILLCGGLSAVFLDFGPASPVTAVLPSTSARLLVTGLLFAGTGSLVALSPLGRRSGAHLNPAVTLAFWTQRKVHPHDVAGYIAAQLLGAIFACGLLRAVWGRTARALHVGATRPGRGLSDIAATAVETIMTASLILMNPFLHLQRPDGPLDAVRQLAARRDPGLAGCPLHRYQPHPARSIGPALTAPYLSDVWVYLAGPLTGAGIAVAIFALFRNRHTVTAKLFYDPRYPSTLGSHLPVARQSERAHDVRSDP